MTTAPQRKPPARPRSRYIPALNYDWLTPYYDPLIHWTMREEQFKRRLIAQAHLAPGQHVLDIGCGTGTLLLLVKRQVPAVEAIGLDGDPKVLEQAARKATTVGVTITWEHGLATALPYPDASFDRVFSSLVFHHLRHADKLHTLQEIRRVLRPGSQFHLADFGRPHNLPMWLASALPWLLGGAASTTDNYRGHLPGMLAAAGFDNVQETSTFTTPFGSLRLYRARKSC